MRTIPCIPTWKGLESFHWTKVATALKGLINFLDIFEINPVPGNLQAWKGYANDFCDIHPSRISTRIYFIPCALWLDSRNVSFVWMIGGATKYPFGMRGGHFVCAPYHDCMREYHKTTQLPQSNIYQFHLSTDAER